MRILFFLSIVLLGSSPAFAAKYSEGTCSVKNDATLPKKAVGAANICYAVRGHSANAQAAGQHHDNCTTAKTAAKLSLLGQLTVAQKACPIDCGGPCKKVER